MLVHHRDGNVNGYLGTEYGWILKGFHAEYVCLGNAVANCARIPHSKILSTLAPKPAAKLSWRNSSVAESTTKQETICRQRIPSVKQARESSTSSASLCFDPRETGVIVRAAPERIREPTIQSAVRPNQAPSQLRPGPDPGLDQWDASVTARPLHRAALLI